MIRKNFSMLVLSFTISFMLFIVEPITLYVNNPNDFWFDFQDMLVPIFVIFACSFLTLLLFFIIVYLLSKKIFKKEVIFKYIFISIFVCFLCAYIHGNFLAFWLPTLDGESISWSNPTPNIISIIVCVLLAAATVFLSIKLGLDDIIKYSKFVTIAVFAMLSVGLAGTILNNQTALTRKELKVFATSKNINTLSSDKNFLILLVDTVDSVPFNKIIESSQKYKDALADFTYYPDTMSGYPYTVNSVPFILSAEWNENKTDLGTYSTKAFNDSPIFNHALQEGYSVNFYGTDFVWNDQKALEIDNLSANKGVINPKTFLKQELKYILFKYLPYPIKQLSHIESMDFKTTEQRNDGDEDIYEWYDDINYNNIKNNQLEIQDQDVLQVVHLEAAHPPFIFDADFNRVNGTYEDKMVVTMTIIEAYIERLKESSVYDNSVVVIMSDHGYVGHRQNPILYIKGVNEKHDVMGMSNKPISHEDLSNAFLDLLDGKQTSEIFTNIPFKRTRRFLWHEGERHIIEYEQRGKAWDETTMQPTGKVYDL